MALCELWLTVGIFFLCFRNSTNAVAAGNSESAHRSSPGSIKQLFNRKFSNPDAGKATTAKVGLAQGEIIFFYHRRWETRWPNDYRTGFRSGGGGGWTPRWASIPSKESRNACTPSRFVLRTKKTVISSADLSQKVIIWTAEIAAYGT